MGDDTNRGGGFDFDAWFLKRRDGGLGIENPFFLLDT